MKSIKSPNTSKIPQQNNITISTRSISPQRNNQYSNVAPRYLEPRSPKKMH